ncbi:alpha/beta fold hydrolase [Brevundimonas sp. UBA2416]|uniref:alpha/beta fold hydrolase n=1 Tax=Brevundimonas sp. UBA2416 TaxID=1946124 RepID=UPI0025BF9DE0|nr:alpha/beta fold hydrolase [Brevundimonas sp. UBA2416]
MRQTRSLIAAVLTCGVLSLSSPATAQTPPPAPPAAPVPPTVELREAGLVADYFAADPATASPGAIIVLGGSEGGLGGSRNLARRLAAAGFDAIAVSYFGESGQSSRLDQVPIEPVARAREWLEARPGPGEAIAVLGVSKGGELALLTASRDPAIKAVVAAVPSHVVWQGIDMQGGMTGSSWTSGGVPLAYVPYDLSNGFISVHALYAGSIASAPAETEIPVEQIAGPILLVSGQADTLWPSTEMANRVEQRLRTHGFAHGVTHLAYADAGHAVFGAPVRADTPGLERALSVGGTIDGLVAARADLWPRVLAFLKDALADD